MSDGDLGRVTRLSDARDRLREAVDPHRRTNRLPVDDADGRVLAEAPTAARPVPHYDRVTADGYAVRATDTFDAGERSPTAITSTEGQVGTEEAVRVHAGGALPGGADAVVTAERTERRDGRLLVYDAVAAGENVARAGSDVSAGQQLFEAGHRLAPSDLSLLRAADRETVAVVDLPRVSVLPTGDGVVSSGVDPEPGATVETNGLLVSRLVDRWDGDPTRRDGVAADVPAIRRAIRADTDHDLVVTIGGSAGGERDCVVDAVDDAGTVSVHGVGIDPGGTVGFGAVDSTVVIVCPGPPVACLVAAVQFLRPAVAWQAETEPRPHPRIRGQLAGKLRSEPGRRTFARVRVKDGAEKSLPTVEPLRTGGAGLLSSVTTADGWVAVPESREGIPAGETVAVQEWERTDTRPGRASPNPD